MEVANACGNIVLPFIVKKLKLVQNNVDAQQEIDADAILLKISDEATKKYVQQQKDDFKKREKELKEDLERYKERVAANNKRLEAENNKKGYGERVADGFMDVAGGVT